MIIYNAASSTADLEGILQLQKQNLSKNITPEERIDQGFVTVDHDLQLLKKLQKSNPHIIAKNGEKVIGYVLTMTKIFRNDIPVLLPMFQIFDKVPYRDKRISDYDYMLVGQVCVDKSFRGQEVFKKLYEFYRKIYKDKYDFAITEVAAENKRSLRAHEKIGFKILHSYTGSDGTEWKIIVWNWK